MGVEVARGFGSCGGRLRVATGRRRINAGIGVDLTAHLRVAIRVWRHGLELVLGDIDHDLLAVVADLQILPSQADQAFPHAEEATDTHDHAVDLAVGVDIDRFDLANRLVLRVLDVAADQLLGVGAGRHGGDLRIGRAAACGLLGVGGTGADRQQAGNEQLLDHEDLLNVDC